jgi:hypothetical protein
VGVALVVAALFRSPFPVLARPAALPKAQIEFVSATDQILLRDTVPLFMPTEHDAAVGVPRREPHRQFLSYDTPKLSFGDTGLDLNALPPTVTLNGKPTEQARPADTLTADFSGRPLQGFGQVALRIVPLPERGGLLEVVSTVTGQQVLTEVLPKEAAPPSEKEWQPLEFMIAVNAAGLVGPLVPIEGSRVEEVDAHFKNFLVQKLRLGARLPPGSYRVIIGP